MSYQGRLLGLAGAPVADGAYDLSFAIYDVPSDPDPPLWTETHNAVPVSAGYFHVILGSVNPIALAFNAPYWLGVSISGGAELAPRVELASAPYSLNAKSVADGAVTAAKIPTGQVVKSLNALRDDVTILAGSNISVTPVGQTLTIAATGVGLNLPYSAAVSDAGTLLLLNNTGTGGAASFRTGNAGNASPALHAVSTGNGPAFFADGITNVGGATRSGELHIFRTGVAEAMIRELTLSTGGRLQLHDEAANQVALLTADNDGSGGYFYLNRNDVNAGFVADGNYLGTGEPRVDIQGSVRSAVFDMSSSGNTSVRLPNDAIAAPEMLDEAGIGFRGATSSVTLDATNKTIVSRSISAPADGHAVVIATVQAQASHVNGVSDAMVFGVSNGAGTMLTGWTQNILISGGAPAGTYYTPTMVQGVFPVTAGSTTFYLLGREDAGTCSADNAFITVIYVPTAYGLVTPPPVAAPGASAMAWPTDSAVLAAMSGAEGDGVATEQTAGTVYAHDRVERELRQMREEMERMKRALEESAALEARAGGSAGARIR